MSAVLLASITQGLTGFGFALVSVPILIIFFPPQVVIPLIIILGTSQTLIVLYDSRKDVNLKRIWVLMVFGMAGIPLGTYVLKILDADVLRALVGIIIVVFAIALISGFRWRVRNEKAAYVPVGFLSGFLNGSISFSGPPVILFFANQKMKKNDFRANIIAYFVILNLATIASYIYSDLITVATVKSAAVLLPVVLTGTIAGIYLSKRVNEKAFRNMALVIVTVSGLMSILSGFRIIG